MAFLFENLQNEAARRSFRRAANEFRYPADENRDDQ